MLKMKNKHTGEISYIDEVDFKDSTDFVFKYKLMKGEGEKKKDLIKISE